MSEVKEISKKWNWVKLGQAVQVLDNLRQPINASERQKRIENKTEYELFPYYGATGQVGWIDDFITEGEYVLVGEDGAPFLDIFKEKAYKIKGKTWVNNHAHILKEINNITINDFILYYLNSINYREYVNGTTRLKLTKGSLIDIPFPIPSILEQQAIVSKIEELFTELDKGIEALHTAQEQLKTYRQSVLKWAFEGKLTNKNVTDGELPKGWKKIKLVKVCEIKRGKSKHRPRNEPSLYGGIYPFIQTGDIRDANGGYILTYTQTYSEKGLQQSKLWNKGTLCITIAANIGETAILGIDACFPDSVVGLVCDEQFLFNKYANYFFISYKSKLDKLAPATAQKNINVEILEKVEIPLPSTEEQQTIIEAIESRFSVADKLEENINQSLQQAAALRQSILKKAFEGKLIAPAKAIAVSVYKPKNEYFYQMQLLGLIAKASEKQEIQHGEMTIAKYAYMLDKIYDVPTFYNYSRWHLGPYPPTIKKAINNRTYFKKSGNSIEVLKADTLFKYTNPFQQQIENAVNDLSSIFSKYPKQERSHKTELLATICKVVEDIQSTDLKSVRKSMKEWEIELKTSTYKTKADKFTETETKNCLQFLKEKGWDKKLIK